MKLRRKHTSHGEDPPPISKYDLVDELNAQIEQQRAIISSLNEMNEVSSEEHLNEVTKLKNDLNKQTDELFELKSSNASLNLQLSQITDERNQLIKEKSELINNQKTNSSENEIIEKLEAEIDFLNSQIDGDKSKDDIHGLREEIGLLKSSLSDSTDQYEKLQKNYTDVTEERDELQVELKQVHDKFIAAELERMSDMDEKKEKLKADYECLKEDYYKLIEKQEGAEQTIENLKQQVQSLEEHIHKMDADSNESELRIEYENMLSKCCVLQADYDSLVSKFDNESTRLNSIIGQLENEKSVWSQTNQDQLSTIQNMEILLKDKEKGYQDEVVEMTNDQLSNMEHALRESRAKVAEIENDYAELMEKYNGVIKAAENTRTLHEIEVLKLRNDLDQVRAESERDSLSNSGLEDELGLLRMQNNDLVEQIRVLSARYGEESSNSTKNLVDAVTSPIESVKLLNAETTCDFKVDPPSQIQLIDDELYDELIVLRELVATQCTERIPILKLPEVVERAFMVTEDIICQVRRCVSYPRPLDTSDISSTLVCDLHNVIKDKDDDINSLRNHIKILSVDIDSKTREIDEMRNERRRNMSKTGVKLPKLNSLIKDTSSQTSYLDFGNYKTMFDIGRRESLAMSYEDGMSKGDILRRIIDLSLKRQIRTLQATFKKGLSEHIERIIILENELRFARFKKFNPSDKISMEVKYKPESSRVDRALKLCLLRADLNV